jgi:hypothetical protein
VSSAGEKVFAGFLIIGECNGTASPFAGIVVALFAFDIRKLAVVSEILIVIVVEDEWLGVEDRIIAGLC